MTLHGVFGGIETEIRQLTKENSDGPHPVPDAEMNYRAAPSTMPSPQERPSGAETSHGVFVH